MMSITAARSSIRGSYLAPPMLLCLALLMLVAIAGGSSRSDSLAQVVVRGGAAMIGIAALLLGVPGDWRRLKLGFVFLGFVALVLVFQLTPLPPGFWAALPGHDIYAETATVSQVGRPWRPLALVPDRTISALFSLIVPLAMLLCLSRLSSRQRAMLTLPLIVLVMVSAVLGLAQMSGGETGPLRWYNSNDRSATGFLANRNHQALLLAIALPVLAAWAAVPSLQKAQRTWRGWAAIGSGAFLILMLPTTGSRAGIVLAILAIGLALAMSIGDIRQRIGRLRRRQRRIAMGGGAGALVAFVALLLLFGRNEAFRRLTTLDATEDLRARTLPVVLDIVARFFPTGTGVGAFDTVFRHFEPFDQLKLTYFNQAHNDLLQIVLEAGVPGALLLVAFIAWWAVAGWRIWRTPASLRSQAARAGWGIVLLTLAASIADYPARTPLIAALLTLGCCWMLVPPADGDDHAATVSQ